MHYHSLLSPTLEHAQRSHGQDLPSMVCGIEIIGDHNPENIVQIIVINFSFHTLNC